MTDTSDEASEFGSGLMAAVARVAEPVARDIRDATGEVREGSLSPRLSLVRALLTSSIDHSVAITTLLARNDPTTAYSAVALFRPQLEALARGIFFLRTDETSDEQVEYFLINDELPKLSRPDGNKPRRPYLDELLEGSRKMLKAFLPPQQQESVDSSFRYALSVYNGFVHGGAKVAVAYQERNDRYDFLPDFRQVTRLAQHSLAMAHFAEGVLMAIVFGYPDQLERMAKRAPLIESYGRVVERLKVDHGL